MRNYLKNDNCIVNIIKLNKWHSISIVIILGIFFSKFGKLNSPYITDEFGYWAYAALYNNYDWNEVISNIPYYGFGYGLLLSLFFKVSNSSVLVFRFAQIFNLFLLIMTFEVIYHILRKIYTGTSKDTLLRASCLSVSLPFFLNYLQLSMPEVLLSFLVSLSVLYFIKVVQEDRTIDAVILSLICICMICVHLRTVVVLAVTLLLLLFLFMNGKKKSIWALLLIVFGVIVVFKLRDYYIIKVFTRHIDTGESHLDYNASVASRMWFIYRLTDIRILKAIFFSLLGKVYYLTIGTLGLVPIAIWRIISNFKIRRNKQYKIIYIYIFLILFSLIAITTVSTLVIGRLDQMFYGRYIEMVLPILIGIGVVEINEESLKTIELFMILMLGTILTIACNFFLKGVDSTVVSTVLPIAIPDIAGLCENASMSDNLVKYTFFLMLEYFVSIFVLFLLRHNEKGLYWFILFTWFTVGSSVFSSTIEKGEHERFSYIREVSQFIKDNEMECIYLSFGQENAAYYDMFNLRFDLMEVPMTVINIDELTENLNKAIVIDRQSGEWFVNMHYSDNDIIFKNNRMVIVWN